LNESQYYTGLNPGTTMTITIVLGSDKTWSWKEVANYNSATASTGNGTFTLDSTAKTLQLTITTSSSTDVLAGTAVNSGYTIASDGKSVTFDLKAANGTGTGTVILAKQ
jgi:hypothetical protein